MTLKEQAWSKIREQKDIEWENGVSSKISSSDIKEITGEEPRLVSSMDSRDKVPEALAKDDLFVLPVNNGEYKLVEGKGYHNLEPMEDEPIVHESSIPFELATTTGESEDRYVKHAFNTGLISRFTGINQLFQGISSRKYSDEFSFHVGENGPITASSVQFQVDGLFEGEDSVVIMEAKADARDNFLIRQLYYPYRHYGDNINKKMKSIFFLYDKEEDTYNFWEYSFRDPNDYSSIQLERSQSYRIEKTDVDVEEYEEVERRDDGRWEIPQADDVEKIQKFPFLVAQGITDYQSMAEQLEFEPRQSSYYREAVEILDLVQNDGKKYALTEKGEEYINTRPDKRNKLLLKQMLRIPVINEVFQQSVSRFGEADPYISKEDIAEIIAENSHLTGSTPKRRARTIISWFRWISKNVGIVEVDKQKIKISV